MSKILSILHPPHRRWKWLVIWLLVVTVVITAFVWGRDGTDHGVTWPVVISESEPTAVERSPKVSANRDRSDLASLPDDWVVPDSLQSRDGNDGRHFYRLDQPADVVQAAVGRLANQPGLRRDVQDGSVDGVEGVLTEVTVSDVVDTLRIGTWTSFGLPAVPNQDKLLQFEAFVGQVLVGVTTSTLPELFEPITKGTHVADVTAAVEKRINDPFRPAGILFVGRHSGPKNLLFRRSVKARLAATKQDAVDAAWVDAMNSGGFPLLKYGHFFVEANVSIPVVTQSGEEAEAAIRCFYSTGGKTWVLYRIECKPLVAVTMLPAPGEKLPEYFQIKMQDYPSVAIMAP